jgi:opacity protein-like surface antigen
MSSDLRGGMLLVSVFFIMAAITANAQENEDRGGYVNFGFGMNWVDQESGTTQPADTGFCLDAAMGYDFSKWIGAEFNTGYIRNTAPETETRSERTLEQIPFLANILLHLPPHSRFDPFLGLGTGIVIGKMDGNIGGDLALQILAGVGYSLNEDISINLHYRFLMLGASSVIAEEPVGDDSLIAGIQWKF